MAKKDFHCVVASFEVRMEEEEIIKNTIYMHRKLKNFLGPGVYSKFLRLAEMGKKGDIHTPSEGRFFADDGTRLVTHDRFMICDSFSALSVGNYCIMDWAEVSGNWERHLRITEPDPDNPKVVYA